MLRLLLDEHLPRALASQLRSGCPALEVAALPDWQGGALLGAGDPELLAQAREAGWTLVTYDQRTIAPLLKEWAESGVAHGGVIFVSRHTLAPNDIGGLIRSLTHVWESYGHLDWQDRVLYLTRGSL